MVIKIKKAVVEKLMEYFRLYRDLRELTCYGTISLEELSVSWDATGDVVFRHDDIKEVKQ